MYTTGRNASIRVPHGTPPAFDLKERGQQFALDVIGLRHALPHNRAADIIARQLLRSATSVGANHRAACRAKSPADFIAKLAIVEEEADESLYWFELLARSGVVVADCISGLRAEANEILAMVVASIRTTRQNGASRIDSRNSRNIREMLTVFSAVEAETEDEECHDPF